MFQPVYITVHECVSSVDDVCLAARLEVERAVLAHGLSLFRVLSSALVAIYDTGCTMVTRPDSFRMSWIKEAVELRA